MWRLIKWLFFIAIVATVVLAITGYKIRGKTVQEHLEAAYRYKVVREGVRDLRSLVGEGLKAAGEAISEDVTDSERAEFENILREEIKRGKPIEGTGGQEALPPQYKTIKPVEERRNYAE